ncbi:hypothetical protein BDK51DRAFT_34746 [Blyttiomyces helicus]|uniref:F-box domain-containing protein n=1 Tax=Blyttiomyces helicus TaxID=388810 RepID=A0A4P9VWV6_9FUNG|nr:hypothetical protein BDK51DRAFT_34746 [Blyttiomyces helicus]|eukprot:RKO84184.1 hypothetical protein BDK51DRAFT_34746 [Blyttiomyces helicus]
MFTVLQTPARSLPFAHLLTLRLEIDHLHLPTTAFPALGSACPNLQTLKLKYAMLGPNAISHLHTHLPALHSLSLSYCDLWHPRGSWASVVLHLAARMNQLRVCHFNQCNLRDLTTAGAMVVDEEAGLGEGVYHSMRSVKMFDTGDARPTGDDLRAIVGAFPRLESLRADIPSQCLTTRGELAWGNGQLTLPFLHRLELRSAKHKDISEEPREAPLPLVTPRIADLAIWAPPLFPAALIFANARGLTRLVLNFLPVLLDDDEAPALPSLKTLEVRGLSVLAHAICLGAVKSLTRATPALTTLVVEALHRDSAPIPKSDIALLVARCPRLRTLRLRNFALPQTALATVLAHPTAWPELETLAVVGPAAAVRAASPEWEWAELAPFLDAHRGLRHIALAVGDIVVPGFQAPLMPSRARVGGGEDRFWAYAETIRRRWWWVREVNVFGPLGASG